MPNKIFDRNPSSQTDRRGSTRPTDPAQASAQAETVGERSVKGLVDLVNELETQKVHFQSITDRIDTKTRT